MRAQSPPEYSGLCLGWGVADPGKTRDESHVISVYHLNLTPDYSHLCCLLFSVSGIKRAHPGDGPRQGLLSERWMLQGREEEGGMRRNGGIMGGQRKISHILPFPADLLVVILSHPPLGIHREFLEAKEMNLCHLAVKLD